MFVAILAVSIVLAILIPIPPIVVDFLIIFNFAFSILILMLTVLVPKPTDFYVFPPLLLLATIYRLSLNIASTRLILLSASQPFGAGLVIFTFGTLVTNQNLVVGFILFLILLTIQHMVVTSGAERIAEVRARFVLEAVPNKQLSIDADLNAGFITTNEAYDKRRATVIEQEFYGTMDGATKFIRGDATVAIISVLVNSLVGLLIGIGQDGLPIGQALQTYTILTIGDGLASRIPALILSASTGFLLTRSRVISR